MSWFSRMTGKPDCKERIACAAETLRCAINRNIEASTRLANKLECEPQRPLHYNPLRDRKAGT